MKKNYFSKVKTMLFNPLTSSLKNLKKGTTSWFGACFVLVGGFEVFGQTTLYNYDFEIQLIKPENRLNIGICNKQIIVAHCNILKN